MKKIFSVTVLLLVLISCNAPSKLELEDQTIVSFSNTNGIPSNLPSMPKADVFATFNNAYQLLADDNSKIGHDDPKNNDKYFVATILSAKSTLDCAFFDVQEDEIVDALIRAKNNGVKVRVVTDSDNMKDKDNPSLPRVSIKKLTDAGIPIIGDNRNPFMHHKFMVVDNNAIWHGATNPTTRGMFEHNSNSVYVKSEQLAKNFTNEFNTMFEKNDFSSPREGKVPFPSINIGDVNIKTFFSPMGGAKKAILDELSKAKKSIKFMAFSFTDSDMASVMANKKAAGIKVEGVYDQCLNGQYSTFRFLFSKGVQVMTDGNQALMHSKTMIIDDKVVINGSYNFSKNAETNNNEDILIISSTSLAKNFIEEYNKVKKAALTHDNIPPYNHPACQHEDPNVRLPKNSTNIASTSDIPDSIKYEL
ncbi:MAG: phospholipase D-like domain-containing protein [Candidatus Sericytochromatia bacterium]